MGKSIVSLGVVLTANLCLAWGQTTAGLPSLPSLPGSESPPQISKLFNDMPQIGEPLQLPSITPTLPSDLPSSSAEEPRHEPVQESRETMLEFEASKRPERFWIRGEYLLWFTKDANLPVLATSASLTDPRLGALGGSTTSILLGGGGEDYLNRSGARFFTGYWFDDEKRLGVEVGYFFLAGISVGQNVASPGNPVLARPFLNANTGQQDSSVVAFPGVTNGSILATTGTFLQGVDLNLTSTFVQTQRFRIEWLAGFRYMNLNESVTVNENDNVAVSPEYSGMPIPFAGNSINVNDNFTTRNDFFGGQVGFRAEYVYKRLSLEVMAKVALGCSNEVVNIHGNTYINTNPATTYNSGLLALSSNSGQFTRDAFSVIPEVGLNLGFQLTNNLKIYGGYSFIYWTNIVRPGDQIDTTLNPNLIPTSSTYGTPGGPARPEFAFPANDYFAHGANFGLEFRY
jgi:Putative beta barrel porin-7 (BBP7)